MNINPIFHRVLKSEEDEALTNPFLFWAVNL